MTTPLTDSSVVKLIMWLESRLREVADAEADEVVDEAVYFAKRDATGKARRGSPADARDGPDQPSH
jgi:hypothetical protein